MRGVAASRWGPGTTCTAATWAAWSATGAEPASGGPVLPLSVGANKVLRYYERRGLGDALDLAVPAPVSREVSRVLRAYVRHVLERELRSVEFMDLVAG